jgi:thiosulfate reductase cytochrome b subunit
MAGRVPRAPRFLIPLLLLRALPAQAEGGCLTCHQDPGVLAKVARPGRALVLDPRALGRSVHAGVDCTDCHTQLSGADADKPHAAKLGPPTCESCHEKVAKTYAASIHGRAAAKGAGDVATCADCHGAHDIVPVKDPASRVAKLKLPFTCAKCHQNAELAKQHGIKEPLAAKQYLESIHGRGLTKLGLIVAPSCTDCHGSHGIQPSSDPRSPINHAQVPKTCGRCHVGVVETYSKSIHGRLLENGDRRGPVCVDCHTAHQIVTARNEQFRLRSDESCGRCHMDRLERYRETYHGKAAALGRGQVAACYDCHGHHDIEPLSNPASKLAAGNRLQTCQQCHPRATANFTRYVAHGDHRDRESYPALYWTYVAMTALLLGVFGFFGLHTLLWVLRSMAMVLRDPRAFFAAKRRARVEAEHGRTYIRFRPVDRFVHMLVIMSFLLLVLTGMPLKFYYTGWARWLLDWMGGAAVASALHRVGAFVTLVYFAVHILSVLASAWRKRALFANARGRFSLWKLVRYTFGPDSPMPNMQDVRDFWAHQKYFFGRGPKPSFDRWTYWEKFDYLAVFWGVAVIGLSGLVMWFPVAFTRVLPGWIINVSLIIHGDEALLAAGFIFTFHFFNVHFRFEKFPMDTVIFSGRISEEEMLSERRRQFDRLQAEGRLKDELLRDESGLRDEWPRWRRIFAPIGIIAFLIGVALIAAIYFAMVKRVLHG